MNGHDTSPSLSYQRSNASSTTSSRLFLEQHRLPEYGANGAQHRHQLDLVLDSLTQQHEDAHASSSPLNPKWNRQPISPYEINNNNNHDEDTKSKSILSSNQALHGGGNLDTSHQQHQGRSNKNILYGSHSGGGGGSVVGKAWQPFNGSDTNTSNSPQSRQQQKSSTPAKTVSSETTKAETKTTFNSTSPSTTKSSSSHSQPSTTSVANHQQQNYGQSYSHNSRSSTTPTYHRSPSTRSSVIGDDEDDNALSNSIDEFIKENERFLHDNNPSNHSSSSDIFSEDNHHAHSHHFDHTMKLPSQTSKPLTEDEKALLNETLKVGLYGSTTTPNGMTSGGDSLKKHHINMNTTPPNGSGQCMDMDECDNLSSCSSSTTSSMSASANGHGKPAARRIILVSKPAPKPEPKPEPKYVNGKVVFGQSPVKPVLKRGSVAERVMLFEKCPEKTSVTKHRLTELQRNRNHSPNKIGHWVKVDRMGTAGMAATTSAVHAAAAAQAVSLTGRFQQQTKRG